MTDRIERLTDSSEELIREKICFDPDWKKVDVFRAQIIRVTEEEITLWRNVINSLIALHNGDSGKVGKDFLRDFHNLEKLRLQLTKIFTGSQQSLLQDCIWIYADIDPDSPLPAYVLMRHHEEIR